MVVDNGLFVDAVADAVATASRDAKPLVVYNSSEESNADSWLNSWFGSIRADLKQKAVWLKLVEGTEQFQQFEEIFPQVVVPSVYVVKDGHIVLVIKQEESDHGSASGNWDILQKTLGIAAEDKMPSKTFKEEVSDISTRVYREEMLKQRKMEQEERRRILRLVEADKAERRARREQKSSDSPFEASQLLHENIKNRLNLQSDTCTLQIRLTNSEVLKHMFASTETLNNVREWIDLHRTDGDRPYLFHRSIPRVTFSESEELKTLAALELAPRSVLILEPVENASRKLNISSAQSPGLFQRVVSGVSSWWSREPSPSASVSAKVSEEPKDSTDQQQQQQQQAQNIPRSSLSSVALNAPDSPVSSKFESPSSFPRPTHPDKNSSEISLPSRSVSPNIFKFVNKDDKDDDKDVSTFNGNNVKLENKKDDI